MTSAADRARSGDEASAGTSVAGAPIDVLVNGRRIASGEVVVIDEEFGVRITEIVAVGDR